MKKSLKEKAIKIKGKDYVLVSDRVLFFNEQYPNGSIRTELISLPEQSRVIIKATVIPDVAKPERFFTGYSQASFDDKISPVNKMAALENAETSAVGRALAMMGIGVIESIASADEVVKAGGGAGGNQKVGATDKQLEFLHKLSGKPIEELKQMGLSMDAASKLIEKIRAAKEAKK